jgi:hypothetical protein
MRDRTMIIAGRLQTDLHRSRKGMEKLHETIVIGAAIGELEAMSAAGCVLNQRDVPIFGNIDCGQVRDRCRVLLVNHRGVCSLE